jgi:hypothetical protein
MSSPGQVPSLAGHLNSRMPTDHSRVSGWVLYDQDGAPRLHLDTVLLYTHALP